MKELFKKLIKTLPVLGPLIHCSRKNHFDSIKEFFVIILFSTATFWVSALMLKAFKSNNNENYMMLLYRTTNAGQLFIFSLAFLGPILISAADDPPNAKAFPGRTSHFSVMVILAITASGFYALQLSARGDSLESLLDLNFLFRASIIIALSSALLRYLTIVYRKSTINFDPDTQLKAPIMNFANEFASRHSGEDQS